MPFTPFHMGPGMLLKALLQSSFSLVIFGWTQIVMDIQPLIMMIMGESHLHGFTHTFIGATLLALFSGLTGKYIANLVFFIFSLKYTPTMKHLIQITNPTHSIKWNICMISSFIGSYSHILLDALMHDDVQPFFPFTLNNPFLGYISAINLYKLCRYTGLIGIILYFLLLHLKRKLNKS